jgi:hypothetical protein
VAIAMRRRLQDPVRLPVIAQHRRVVGDLHERAERAQDGFRVGKQVFVADLPVPRTECSTVIATFAYEASPVDGGFADGFDAEVRVEVRLRDVATVSDEMYEA